MGRHVTVVGRGTATGTNDLAVLSLAASARATTPADAMTRAGYAISRMRESALAGGIDPADCATSAVSLTPVHDPWPTVTGYEASFGLTVTVAALDRIGSLLVAVAGAGGDGARVDGVRFSHRDPVALERSARDAAYADALVRATQYAGLAGQALGEVRTISEAPDVGIGGPRPVALATRITEAVTMDPGGATVDVTVTVTWALGPT